jgi:IclR family acetate operon transcriptional repressor
MRDKPQNAIASLQKGVDLLFLFVDSPTLGVREIADRLHVPVSTAYRFVRTFRDKGLLEQDPVTRKYQLGLRLLSLEAPILRPLDVRRTGLPHMEVLAQHCQETVQLTLRRGFQGVIIEVVESPEPLRVAPARGQSVPLHSGALAKAILAFLPKPEIDRYFASGPLQRFTPDTITDPTHLGRELARIRKRGYAVSRQEVVLGAGGVAAPIFDSTGQVIASIGVSAPLQRLTAAKIVETVPEVLRHAEKMSAELGRR